MLPWQTYQQPKLQVHVLKLRISIHHEYMGVKGLLRVEFGLLYELVYPFGEGNQFLFDELVGEKCSVYLKGEFEGRIGYGGRRRRPKCGNYAINM